MKLEKMTEWLKSVTPYLVPLLLTVVALFWVPANDPEKVVAVSAVVNVLVVAGIYVWDRDYQRRRGTTEIKLYWFRKLVSERINERVHGFFDGCMEIAEEGLGLKTAGNLTVGEYSEEVHRLFERYSKLKVELLNKFEEFASTVDPRFGQALRDMIIRFQDDFTTCLYQELDLTSTDAESTRIMNLIQSQRLETLQFVIEYELSGCRLKRKPNGPGPAKSWTAWLKRDPSVPPGMSA